MAECYRLKLRILNLSKGRDHVLHCEPVTGQILPLLSSGHSAQRLSHGCLIVVIWYKQEGVAYCCHLHVIWMEKLDMTTLKMNSPPPSDIWQAILILKKCNRQGQDSEVIFNTSNRPGSIGESNRTYMISEASSDIRIFLSFLSSIGILSRMRLNLRTACSDIVEKFFIIKK